MAIVAIVVTKIMVEGNHKRLACRCWLPRSIPCLVRKEISQALLVPHNPAS
jgi:hypothetical protein